MSFPRTGCFVVAALLLATTAYAEDWKEEKGEHFIVLYRNESVRPRDILDRAERYYKRIADDLGYARYSNFWQWDNRAKIYVHPAKESFQKMTGQPAWSDGAASYLDKSIHTIEGTENFLDILLPHEITHLIFRDFVGLKSHVPLWMDEGVAQWGEDAKREKALQWMPELVRKTQIFTVRSLMDTDIRLETDVRKVEIYYLQAISLVDFLIRKYGASRFTEFCRELRDGKLFEDALRGAYSPQIQTMDDFQDKWIDYVLAKKEGS